jgi:hypothetical protein
MHCEICSAEFSNSKSFVNHLKTHHSLTSKQYLEVNPNKPKCPICGNCCSVNAHHFRYNRTCGSEPCKTELSVRNISETKFKKYGNSSFNNRNKFKKTIAERPLEVSKNISVSISFRVKKYWNEMPDSIRNEIGHRISSTKKSKPDELKTEIANKTITTRIQRGWYSGTKKYPYDDLNFDSKAEIEVYKFCKKNNLKVKYQPCSFKYMDSLGRTHSYIPDFEIEGKLYEVKGNHLWKDGKIYFPYRNTLTESELKKIDARDLAKTECMRANNVTVIPSTDIDKLDNFLN